MKHLRSGRWRFIAVSVIAVIFIAIILNVMSSDKTDLSLWINEDDRVDLLQHLLQEDISSHVDRKNLSTTSPLYGLSRADVLALLGPADESYSDELIYDLGNIDASVIGNMIVPQTAMLHLYFLDDRCTEYSIYT